MTAFEERGALHGRLLQALSEAGHDRPGLLTRLDSIGRADRAPAHAELLALVVPVDCDDDEARRIWEAVLAHRTELGRRLLRDPGLRVALLDYLLNARPRLVHPVALDPRRWDTLRAGAGTDAATGLAADPSFRAALLAELARGRRACRPVAVALLDFDSFLDIDRRLGRAGGDRVLREAARVVAHTVREVDLAARPGGDEIALLLPRTDRAGACLAAERVRREVQAFFARRRLGGRPVGLTVSIGVAAFPDDAASASELLSRVALALYEAKARGGDRVVAAAERE